MPRQHLAAARWSRGRWDGRLLLLATAFAAVGSRAMADPAASDGWLAFLTQQSLRDRDAALVALGAVGLLGGTVFAAALFFAGLLARCIGLDPPQRGSETQTLGSDRGPRRSRSARRRREEP